MPDTLTTNYGLVKPEVGSSTDTWGGKLNDDMDELDTIIKGVEDKADDAQETADEAVELANAAQAAADSIGFKNVTFLTFADSPRTITQADAGTLLSVDTSGGAFVFNLPSIAALTLPYAVGIKKTTGDANAITINVNGTDRFDDGSSAKSIQYISGATLIPDTDTTPDKWSSSDWGAATGQHKRQTFVAGVGFTAGVSTTVTLTDTPIASADTSLLINFDGVTQQSTEWVYNAATGVVTFDAAIPAGVAQVECSWSTPILVGTPADGSVGASKITNGAVTFDKLAAGAIASQAEAEAGTATDKLMTPERVEQAIGALAKPEFYESGQQSVANGATASVTPGTLTAGRKWDIEGVLVNTTAEAGYLIGDEITMKSAVDIDQTSAGRGLILFRRGNDIIYRVGASGILIINHTTGVVTALTGANWRLVIRARAWPT